jgi:hypothetical protein
MGGAVSRDALGLFVVGSACVAVAVLVADTTWVWYRRDASIGMRR